MLSVSPLRICSQSPGMVLSKNSILLLPPPAHRHSVPQPRSGTMQQQESGRRRFARQTNLPAPACSVGPLSVQTTYSISAGATHSQDKVHDRPLNLLIDVPWLQDQFDSIQYATDLTAREGSDSLPQVSLVNCGYL